MRKCLTLIMILLFFLSGCGKSAAADPSDKESEDLASLFKDGEVTNEVGAVDFGLIDPIETVYSYNGEPLKIPFRLLGAAEGTTTEVGVLLYVGGVAQPYSVQHTEGEESDADYMQVFNLEEGQEEIFDMVFQPVTGNKGDSLSVTAVTILKPSYMPESVDRPIYGNYHGNSATIARHISFEQDCPQEKRAAYSEEYEVAEISKDITDRLEAWNALDQLDTTPELELVADDDNLIRGNGKKVEITVRFYGGPETDFNITFFINHQPVKINGKDYMAVQTKKNKMVEFTVAVDSSKYGELNTVYAIAAASGESDVLDEQVKSTSVLFVNKETEK